MHGWDGLNGLPSSASSALLSVSKQWEARNKPPPPPGVALSLAVSGARGQMTVIVAKGV